MSSHGKRSGRGMKPKPVATRPLMPSTRPARTTPRNPKKPAGRFDRRLLAGVAIVAVVAVGVLAITFLKPGGAAKPTRSVGPIGVPSATPMASPLAQPASSGVTATIETAAGNFTIQLYDESAPVAATNFINLVRAGFYNGLTFHRLVPGFVIQGGDPNGNGSGGPGYTIPDEPVVGQYGRGIVAMARTQQPNSQGSQFFIVLNDSAKAALEKVRTYDIFGIVTDGMNTVDNIAVMPNAGTAKGNAAITPVIMDRVTIASQ